MKLPRVSLFMGTQDSDTKRRIAFLAAALFSLVISQLGSYLVRSHLQVEETYVVNSFLHLTEVRNTGGVFGSFQGNSVLFAVLSGSLLLGISFYMVRTRSIGVIESISIGLLTGGGASNVLDRLLYGAVIDFIDIQNIPYWHYIFNTADIMIHIGGWSLLIRFLFFRRSEQSMALE